jgi:hypothetical protein
MLRDARYERAEPKPTALIGRYVAPIALNPYRQSDPLFFTIYFFASHIAMGFIPLVLRDAVLSRSGNTFERPAPTFGNKHNRYVSS